MAEAHEEAKKIHENPEMVTNTVTIPILRYVD